MKFILFTKVGYNEIPTTADMSFENLHDEHKYLRELSIAFRGAGCRTELERNQSLEWTLSVKKGKHPIAELTMTPIN